MLEEKYENLDTEIINALLKDHTTDKNILWLTDNYLNLGITPLSEMSTDLVQKICSKIKPRVKKNKIEQNTRIRDKAEVFTPSWICNKQNNLIDNAWFGYEGAFNKELEHNWEENKDKIHFKNNRTWKDYVLLKRLEISCGEAPYLISRYDTTTGDTIPIQKRIGLLDRKLRVIHENTSRKNEWIEWSRKAFQSIYGYEWQGDNLFLSRKNLD